VLQLPGGGSCRGALYLPVALLVVSLCVLLHILIVQGRSRQGVTHHVRATTVKAARTPAYHRTCSLARGGAQPSTEPQLSSWVRFLVRSFRAPVLRHPVQARECTLSSAFVRASIVFHNPVARGIQGFRNSDSVAATATATMARPDALCDRHGGPCPCSATTGSRGPPAFFLDGAGKKSTAGILSSRSGG
jgi:hypothetical protein